MFTITAIYLIFLFFNENFAVILFEGDDCVVSHPQQQNGKCLLIQNCQYAMDILKNRHVCKNCLNSIQHCGFDKDTPIVCCPTIQTTLLPPTVKSKFPQTPEATTKQNKNLENQYRSLTFFQSIIGSNCLITSPLQQNGTCVSMENCIYAMNMQKKLQFSNKNILDEIEICHFNNDSYMPIVCCPNDEKIIEQTIRKLKKPGEICKEKCEEMLLEIKYGTHPIISGKKSLAREFPHMAILGFESNNSRINWLCGGSLISKNYVLTAAHCTYNKDYDYVKYVRLGDLDINDPTDDAEPQNFTIVKITSHPLYKPPKKYNDIALLQLDRDVTFTAHVQPACLYDVKNLPKRQVLTATGWGLTEFGGKPSNHLMKVDLNEYQLNICQERYKTGTNRTLPNGILDEIQFCAGGPNKDTCEGDSGGPLQFKKEDLRLDIYTIIVGVTSLGKACGNAPGLYTRVSFYLDWIESIVWPI